MLGRWLYMRVLELLKLSLKQSSERWMDVCESERRQVYIEECGGCGGGGIIKN